MLMNRRPMLKDLCMELRNTSGRYLCDYIVNKFEKLVLNIHIDPALCKCFVCHINFNLYFIII